VSLPEVLLGAPAVEVDLPVLVSIKNIVVDCLRVGIFKIRKPMGAPKIEIRIIMVTSKASDSTQEG
jgi:hypothetical protein